MFVPLTPLAFKQRAVQLFGDRIGVIDGSDRYTYRQFGHRTQHLANALREAGLKPADRVAYLAYNSAPLLEGYYGVLEAGGILLPINVRLRADEIAFILNDADASFLLIDSDFADTWAAVQRSLNRQPVVVWLGSVSADRSEQAYEEWLVHAPSDPAAAPDIDENAVAELFYTSGTTGRPKGVMLTHRNLYLHAVSTLCTLAADHLDVQLHSIPLFHVNGWGTPQSLTLVGGTHVMMRRFDPSEALRLIEAESVTRMLLVPTMMNLMLNHPDVQTRNLASLKFVNLGGAPTPPEMIKRAEAILGCSVFAGYGLSETSPVLTVAVDTQMEGRDTERVRRQASAGRPLVGVDLRIVDDGDHPLPWDGLHEGEIVVRSNVVMSGYWHDPDGTSAVIRDGWFHTGDIARVDPDGYVHIVDRAKDIIISGGENISSVEIEKVLYEHPAVLENAVIGVPDEVWGEVPKALVVLRPGSVVPEAELLDFLRQHLAGFKVPKSVQFLDVLPKGGTGKILKAQMRAQFWSGHGTNVH